MHEAKTKRIDSPTVTRIILAIASMMIVFGIPTLMMTPHMYAVAETSCVVAKTVSEIEESAHVKLDEEKDINSLRQSIIEKLPTAFKDAFETTETIDEGNLETQSSEEDQYYGSDATTDNGESGGFWLDVASRGASQALIDAGGIVEYFPGLYAAHDYDAGGIFKQFSVGDIVHIDGYDVQIAGCVHGNYWSDTYENIRARTGWDCILFQTCEGGDCGIVVYYGYPVEAGSEMEFYSNSPAVETEAYNAEVDAFNTEAAALDAEETRVGNEWADAMNSGDEERIAQAEAALSDVKARIADHNARGAAYM